MAVKINKDVKSAYCSKVHPPEAGKEKAFWKTFKPLFSSTCTVTDKIVLVANEVIVTEDKDVAECINSYFASIVEILSIPSQVIEDYERPPHLVLEAINKYASHQSVKKI